MTVEEQDQLRSTVYDYLYHNGPQSVEQLSTQLAMNHDQVVDLIHHDWFSVQDSLVGIATNSA